VIATQTTVIRRVPARIVPGWIVARPSRASQQRIREAMGQQVSHGAAMVRVGK
jgi:hypothetical protein